MAYRMFTRMTTNRKRSMIPGNLGPHVLARVSPQSLTRRVQIFFRDDLFMYTCFSLTQYAKLNRDDWLYIKFGCSNDTARFEDNSVSTSSCFQSWHIIRFQGCRLGPLNIGYHHTAHHTIAPDLVYKSMFTVLGLER